MSIETISAITLFVSNMARSCRFYSSLGFELKHGGDTASFTSFYAGGSFLNLAIHPGPQTQWGRVIFYVEDVEAGYKPEFKPRDAEWGSAISISGTLMATNCHLHTRYQISSSTRPRETILRRNNKFTRICKRMDIRPESAFEVE